MAVRNLRDWSALDLCEDPIHADLELVDAARLRYQKIAATIDHAVTKLKTIAEDGSGGQKGEWVKSLRAEAESLQQNLTKAGRRYHDVAKEINTYKPELAEALTETAGALDDARAARAAEHKASTMPDPQPDENGTLSPEESRKDREKRAATGSAQDALQKAKNRLNRAMADLDRAGKHFGDMVNCKKYDDGLTDKMNWRLTEFLKGLAKAFSIIGMILLGLSILLPGVNALILGGVLAGAVALGANAALYHFGEGSLVEVILGSLGIAFGLSMLALAARLARAAGSRPGGNNDIPLGPMRPPGSQGPPVTSRPSTPGTPNPSGSGAGGSAARPPTPPPSRPSTPSTTGPGAPPPAPYVPPFWFNWSGSFLLWSQIFRPSAFLGHMFREAGGRSIALQFAKALPGLRPLLLGWSNFGSFLAFATLIHEGGRLAGTIPVVNPKAES